MTRLESHNKRRPARGRGLLGLCIAYFLIILDAGVLNLALPTIRDGLGTSLASAQWVLDGYTLPLAALLLTSGRVGDRYGHRRVLLAGLTVFIVASAGCAASPSIAWLTGCRVAQGVGAAILLPATLALIPHLYPDQEVRDRATVRWVGTGAVAMAAAPLLGGALIELAGWRSIFLINLPAGVVALVLIRSAANETPRIPTVSMNPAGQLLIIVGLTLLATGAILTGTHAWSSSPVLGCVAAGMVAVLVFVWSQHRSPAPLIPSRMLRDPLRTAAIASAGVMGFGFYGALLALSIALQTGRGWSALQAGIGLLPMTVASTVGPVFAYRRLARRHHPASILTAGFIAVILGAMGLSFADFGVTYLAIIPTMLLIGGASTICFSALTSLLVSRTPPADIGLGSALQNTTRQTGALMAYAIIGSVLARGTDHALSLTAAILAVVTVFGAGGVLIAKRTAA
ncbi:MFS transporter [Spelaeicoccus albus]|uniref:DHA2 family methylenomycin A resistance protein-like MFS transporter n=1 Tax=Spelaeicoccus albus TaxID=1280376 RepID=A0A7Z0D0X8_9MICO|nr:MFS transporter [Spelaeicoccus albus]NYI66023.1 DHA2 family methylenomycin A resistance protein-like MFS transporter [Spelaeicoccus albus]